MFHEIHEKQDIKEYTARVIARSNGPDQERLGWGLGEAMGGVRDLDSDLDLFHCRCYRARASIGPSLATSVLNRPGLSIGWWMRFT